MSRFTSLLVFVAVVSQTFAFSSMHLSHKVTRQNYRNLSKDRASPSLLSALPESLELVTNNQVELKQYVPLFTCSLVIFDIIAGRPFLNMIASFVFKKQRDDLLASQIENTEKQDDMSTPSKARIDIDAMVEQSLKQAQNARESVEYMKKKK